MSKFTDNLWQDLVREHGETLVQAERPEAGRTGRAGRATILRRPRVIAGGSLGLAGVGAALVLALGGTAATAPAAFALTQHDDGSVVAQLNYFTRQNLPELNAKLAAHGNGRGGHDPDGARPGSRSRDGHLHPGGGRVGTTGEDPRGHERHRGHRFRPVRWQYRGGYLPLGQLLHLEASGAGNSGAG